MYATVSVKVIKMIVKINLQHFSEGEETPPSLDLAKIQSDYIEYREKMEKEMLELKMVNEDLSKKHLEIQAKYIETFEKGIKIDEVKGEEKRTLTQMLKGEK
jgi:hypothetical protein